MRRDVIIALSRQLFDLVGSFLDSDIVNWNYAALCCLRAQSAYEI
jgi:hypothetical protein